jgi:hypothetical protein
LAIGRGSGVVVLWPHITDAEEIKQGWQDVLARLAAVV